MPKEREARGDDGAVLGPVPTIEAKRLVEKVEGFGSDGSTSAGLCRDEVEHCFERPRACPVDGGLKRILARGDATPARPVSRGRKHDSPGVVVAVPKVDIAFGEPADEADAGLVCGWPRWVVVEIIAAQLHRLPWVRPCEDHGLNQLRSQP